MSAQLQSVTVVYTVVDEAAFRDGGNPLRYEHHGIKAHTVAAYDAVARCAAMRSELERVREIVSEPDFDSINAVLAELEK